MSLPCLLHVCLLEISFQTAKTKQNAYQTLTAVALTLGPSVNFKRLGPIISRSKASFSFLFYLIPAQVLFSCHSLKSHVSTSIVTWLRRVSFYCVLFYNASPPTTPTMARRLTTREAKDERLLPPELAHSSKRQLGGCPNLQQSLRTSCSLVSCNIVLDVQPSTDHLLSDRNFNHLP